MRHTRFPLTSIGLAASIVATTAADSLHVPGDYPTIQAAINAASNGDEVVVADGSYTGPGNTNNKTLGKKITVRSATGAANCTIEGTAFEFWSGDSPDTVIDGFTIRNAGGAVIIFNSSPTIRHCVITDCYSFSDSGPGMWISGPNSHPLIEHCIFANNSTFGFGGAITIQAAKPTIRACIFSANLSNGYGGGIYINPNSMATIDGCTFVGNSVSGIYSEGASSDPVRTVVNCLFSGNQAGNFGAGGGVHSTQSSMQIINCTFTGNVGAAVGKRGTIVNSILADSVSMTGEPLAAQILGNPADFTISFSDVENGWTGPGSNNIDADPQFMQLGSGTWKLAPFYDASVNRTVYTDTDATFVPGALVGRVMNPDTAQQRRQYIAANTATTISVYGNFSSENRPPNKPDNLLVDVNDAYVVFDVRPVAGSPVIDAGNNAALSRGVLVDLDGQPRFVDDPVVADTGAGRAPIVDMGAFERQIPMGADVNGDGSVNSIDLGMLLGAWGTPEPSADLDGDGIVGATDLAILLGAWTV